MAPPRTRPKLVLFDIDGVLCHYDRAALAGALGQLTGHSAGFVREAVWGSGLETRSDRGEVDAEAYLREMSDRLGHPVSRTDWAAARRASMTPDLPVLALAARVKRTCAIAGLTNNSPMLAEEMAVICPDIAQHLQGAIVTSGMLGATKPQFEAYQRCILRFAVQPSDVYFVDDVEANVEGAIAAGLQASLFTGAEHLAQELGAFGLL